MKRFLLFVGLLAVLAVLVSACGGSDSDSDGQLQLETARAVEAAQRAQLVAALVPLNPLGFHDLDPIIRNEGRIPADARIWATRARETLDWVDWPAELNEHVTQFAEWLDALLAAFRDDDAAAAAEPSRISHALAHTFEVAVEAWLNNDTLPDPPPLAGLEPPEHEHEEHSGHDEDDDHEHDE